MGRVWWLPLLVALLFAGAWWWARVQQPVTTPIAVPADCDLAAGRCHLVLPSGAPLVVGLTPTPPSVMKPLTLSLATDQDTHAAWADVTGLGMDMGLTRTELAPAADGLWKGQLVLPLCTNAVMHWEARLYVQRKSGVLAVPLRFHTGS